MLVQYNDQLIKRRVFLNNLGISVLRLVLIRSTNLIWWTEESFWNQASTVQRKLRCLWSVRLLVCVSWLRLCLRLCWIPAFVVRLRRAVYLSLSDLMWLFLTCLSSSREIVQQMLLLQSLAVSTLPDITLYWSRQLHLQAAFNNKSFVHSINCNNYFLDPNCSSREYSNFWSSS